MIILPEFKITAGNEHRFLIFVYVNVYYIFQKSIPQDELLKSNFSNRLSFYQIS